MSDIELHVTIAGSRSFVKVVGLFNKNFFIGVERKIWIM